MLRFECTLCGSAWLLTLLYKERAIFLLHLDHYDLNRMTKLTLSKVWGPRP
jgi:hypothetical protein